MCNFVDGGWGALASCGGCQFAPSLDWFSFGGAGYRIGFCGNPFTAAILMPSPPFRCGVADSWRALRARGELSSKMRCNPFAFAPVARELPILTFPSSNPF